MTPTATAARTTCPTCTKTGKTCAACTTNPTGRCLACRLTHAMDMVEAAKVVQGAANRVQFTHNGGIVTGHVIRYGRYTKTGIGTVDYFLDVRLTHDEARRYRMSDVTDMTAAPLSGVLPTCTTTTDTPGGRCTECRVLRRNHA